MHSSARGCGGSSRALLTPKTIYYQRIKLESVRAMFMTDYIARFKRPSVAQALAFITPGCKGWLTIMAPHLKLGISTGVT
jgi:hypothetical protein